MELKLLQQTPPWEWPKNASKTFLKFLTNKHASESDRLAAADMAGEIVAINDALADALMAIVGDSTEPAALRAKAVISLGPVLEQGDTMGFDDPDDVPITLRTFDRIQTTLQRLYRDTSIPKTVRRRILEASVRADAEWHREAIAAAYANSDDDWKLTAVFCMRYVDGFEDQILQSLTSNNLEIQAEAVAAAGNWELPAAWPFVLALVEDKRTPKPLLIQAIGAIADLRPKEAGNYLVDFANSDDEEIAEAANEAIMMADSTSGFSDDEEDEEKADWVN